MNPVQKAIKERCSTRGYSPEPLSEEELKNLIDAGLQAPTAANRQELHFTVIPGDAPVLKELSEAMSAEMGGRGTGTSFYYDAPTVIFISGDENNSWSAVDAGIAVENIALAAEGMGLGSVILGCMKRTMLGEKKEHFAKAMHFPEGYQYYVAIAAGHKTIGKEPHTYDEDALVTRI